MVAVLLHRPRNGVELLFALPILVAQRLAMLRSGTERAVDDVRCQLGSWAGSGAEPSRQKL